MKILLAVAALAISSASAHASSDYTPGHNDIASFEEEYGDTHVMNQVTLSTDIVPCGVHRGPYAQMIMRQEGGAAWTFTGCWSNNATTVFFFGHRQGDPELLSLHFPKSKFVPFVGYNGPIDATYVTQRR